MKRYLDVIVASALFMIALPLMLFLLIVIPLESHGSPLFSQVRVGRGGKLFRMYKFRSMQKGDMPVGLDLIELKQYDRGRVTRIGKIIRIGLDELPQLVHIIVGQMSLVGPRPLPPSQVMCGTYSPERDFLRPGLTGLAVISLRHTRVNHLQKMVAIDNIYARRRTLCLDLWIISRTPRALITRKHN